MDISSEEFARAFGDALKTFLDNSEWSYAEAARRMSIGKATLNTYLHDCKGKRAKARVEILFQACAELGFTFEYNGYRIGAESLRLPAQTAPSHAEQFAFDFIRQFNLTDDDGTLGVRLRRELGRLELTVSLRAAS